MPLLIIRVVRVVPSLAVHVLAAGVLAALVGRGAALAALVLVAALLALAVVAAAAVAVALLVPVTVLGLVLPVLLVVLVVFLVTVLPRLVRLVVPVLLAFGVLLVVLLHNLLDLGDPSQGLDVAGGDRGGGAGRQGLDLYLLDLGTLAVVRLDLNLLGLGGHLAADVLEGRQPPLVGGTAGLGAGGGVAGLVLRLVVASLASGLASCRLLDLRLALVDDLVLGGEEVLELPGLDLLHLSLPVLRLRAASGRPGLALLRERLGGDGGGHRQAAHLLAALRRLGCGCRGSCLVVLLEGILGLAVGLGRLEHLGRAEQRFGTVQQLVNGLKL